VRLLLDEMYPAALAKALDAAGAAAITAADLGLAGRSDLDLFAAAVSEDLVLLTENVSDFARIAAQHTGAGRPHAGVLIALSSRFSRRPPGRKSLVAAVLGALDQPLADRVVYLEPPDRD